MKKTTINADKWTIDRIGTLSKKWECTQTGTIQRAVEIAAVVEMARSAETDEQFFAIVAELYRPIT